MASSPSETFAAYVRAFAALRAEEVVSFYSLPCTFIRPDGVWAVTDEPTALVLVNHLIDHSVSQGYRSTVVKHLTERALAPSLTELSGDFERYDEGGSSLGTFGFTYVLRLASNDWKIIVAMAHDPTTVT